ncbi:guanine nucleotide-exchange factor SEC12, putative [Plasmodium reichenowi]|uniref:Guanine nucleotide-exchange factor SEC12, putative n=1 Tax=Plasmodium reichenowi TaxID=5854 RepID=A0A151LBY8_PLARE|nr:guanine nucleotide-exchange factor SEC12, putative [Plasmodium reichenowi]KYN96494.1 guanine nucleotide-exchange factor SEC12, putative [Plasmodium reichenowi]
MNEMKVSYLNYPIYGIGSNKDYVVTSGGGGGKNYGIEDMLDINIFNEKEKKLEVVWSTTEQRGVVDSIIYVEKYNIWLGSVKNECILFEINEETGPNILLTFVTDFNERNARQVVVKFSSKDDLILTGGEDKTLRLWKLNFVKREKENKDDIKSDIKGDNKKGNDNKTNEDNKKGDDNKTNEDNKKDNDNKTNEDNKKDNDNKTHDDNYIAVNNNLYLDKNKSVEHLGDFVGHDDSIKDCDISFDEKIVCTCSSDHSLKIWDTNSFVNLHTEQMKSPQNKNDKLNFRCCKFLNHSNSFKDFTYTLLTTAYTPRGSSYLIIWKVYYNDKKEKFTFTKDKFIWINDRPCCNIAVSTNQKFIALGFSTGALKIYNSKFYLLAHYKKHELPITAMCFIKDDNYLLSAGADYTISTLHINSFMFRYLRKFGRFIIYFLLLFFISIILLDSFNVGYDLRISSLFHNKAYTNITKKKRNYNVDPKKNKVIMDMDEL